MKKGFTLTGTENNGFRHRYSFKKEENFKQAFAKFMADLNFEEEQIKKTWLRNQEDEEGEIQQIEIKISEIEDVCWNYKNSKFDVDVFYGNKKIIIVVRTQKRIPMVKHLEKKSKWIKPISIKKIPERKGIQIKVKQRK